MLFRVMVSSSAPAADEPAGVDVDHRERLSEVEQQVAAGREIDATVEGRSDGRIDAVGLEQRRGLGIQLDPVDELRLGGAHPAQDAAVLTRGVDQHLVHIRASRSRITRSDRSASAWISTGAFAPLDPCVHVRPQMSQEPQVALEILLGRAGCGGAHDDAHVLRLELASGAASGRARRREPPADARALAVGREHQEPACQGKLHGHAGALGAHRVLDHLYQHLLAGLEQILDAALAPLLGVEPRQDDVVLVQETVFGEADIDERGLHPRQHVVHFAEIDVADQRALAAALDQGLNGLALLEYGDAQLRQVDGNQDGLGLV